MMTCFADTVCVLPSLPVTSTWPLPARRPRPGDVGDLVLLEQEADPLDQPLADLARALDGLGHVGLDLAHGHAELLGVAQVRDHGRALQQRLGGDAADVQAHPAQVALLDARRLVSELRGLDGGHVAAGPGADHHDVEAVVRQRSPQQMRVCSSMPAPGGCIERARPGGGRSKLRGAGAGEQRRTAETTMPHAEARSRGGGRGRASAPAHGAPVAADSLSAQADSVKS